MKLTYLAWATAVLLLLGFGSAVLGFLMEGPIDRTLFQVLGLVSLTVAIGAAQLAAYRWRQMLDAGDEG